MQIHVGIRQSDKGVNVNVCVPAQVADLSLAVASPSMRETASISSLVASQNANQM